MKILFFLLFFYLCIDSGHAAQYVAGYPQIIKVSSCSPTQYICIGKIQGTQTRQIVCKGKNKVCPTADECLRNERDSELTKEDPTPEWKMHQNALQCNEPALRITLKNNPYINVTTLSDIKKTAAMSAILGLRRRILTGNCKDDELNPCFFTLGLITKHLTYNYKNPADIEINDVMELLQNSNTIPSNGVCQNYYEMALFNLVRSSNDFSFNYLSSHPNSNYMARTSSALAACAIGGTARYLCLYLRLSAPSVTKKKRIDETINLDLRIDSKKEMTPLMAAVYYKNTDVVRYLIGEGADVYQTIDGMTVEQFANANGRADMAKVIHDTRCFPKFC